jgi:hypothetical protein
MGRSDKAIVLGGRNLAYRTPPPVLAWAFAGHEDLANVSRIGSTTRPSPQTGPISDDKSRPM